MADDNKDQMSLAEAPQAEEETQLAPPRTTPMDLLQIATETGADIDKFEKLMDLQERWQAEEARKAFAEAMAGFQAECPTVLKEKEAQIRTKSGSNYTVEYASLDDIIRAVRHLMQKYGFSAQFDTNIKEHAVEVICLVTHRSGHEKPSRFEAPIDTEMHANSTQQVASANTYAKRYAFCNAFNIVASSEDDDAFLLTQDKITRFQIQQIEKQIKEIKEELGKPFDRKAFVEDYLGVERLEDLPASKFGFALRGLAKKASAKPKITKPGEKKEKKMPLGENHLEVLVEGVEEQSGTSKKGKPYTLYKAFFRNSAGEEFMSTTFSESLAEKARELEGQKVPAVFKGKEEGIELLSLGDE